MERPPRPPEDGNGEPEPEQLSRLLFSVEDHINERGWDQPPELFALDRPSEHEITVRPLITPDRSVHPADMLGDAAEIFRAPLARARLPRALGTEYFGLLLAWEGWGRFGAASATTDRSRRLADQPGSVECRGLQLRTLSGHEQALWRVRGYDPFLLSGAPEGRIVEGLRSLMHAIEGLRR